MSSAKATKADLRKSAISASKSDARAATELDTYLDIEEQNHKNIKSDTLFKLFTYILKHPGPLSLGLLMVVLGTSAVLVEPRIIGFAIDEAIVPKRGDLLRNVSFGFLAVTAIRVFSLIQQGFFFELLGQRVTQDLRIRLFSHLERLPVATFDKNPSGRLMTRVTNDIASLNEMFTAGFLSMISNFLLVIGILTWLMVLNLRLGLIATSVFPVMVLVSVYFSNRLKIAYREARSKLSALNSFLAENLSGMKTVHLFNRQKLHQERFDRFNQWYADAQVSSIRVFAFFQPTITISAGISVGLIIWFGGRQAIDGSLKIGVLVVYFSYILSLFQPVREIADKWNIFLSGMASAERVFSVLDWPTEIDEASITSPAHPIQELKGEIRFENVWFAYEGENWVLKDFSLEIYPGQKTGIVGHTGAGKSTLMSLLMRFYEPQRGRILIDGKDIRDYDKRSLRASIGIVQQDVFLFSGSFEENVTFWKESSPAKVDSVLNSLGFDIRKKSSLQERGGNFSMGERQVIAFARAMANDPRIWILDEATANMDSETEALLQRALDVSSQNRTSILIAHRLATVKDADQILVLHKGNLIERGHHDELMEINGLYARLYRYQNYGNSPLAGES